MKLERKDTTCQLDKMSAAFSSTCEPSYHMDMSVFELLSNQTSGEASMIVRSTFDKFGLCGYGALYFLKSWCMPNTHAREIQPLTEVM